MRVRVLVLPIVAAAGLGTGVATAGDVRVGQRSQGPNQTHGMLRSASN